MSNMITRTYSKPFHQVVLHYEEGKTETPFEKELVKRYHSFIDNMSENHQRMKPLEKRYNAEKGIIEQHEKETKNYHRRFTALWHTMEGFKKAGMGNGIDMGAFQKLSQQFEKENTAYNTYHRKMVNPWREITADNEAEFYQLHAWFDKEGEDKAHDHFDDYGKELYTNHDKYGLCLNQWDINVDDMHGEMDKANKQWEALFDLREETVAMYLPVYHRIKQINELIINLVKDINGLNDSRLTFNN